jgi:hypothetical protein
MARDMKLFAIAVRISTRSTSSGSPAFKKVARRRGWEAAGGRSSAHSAVWVCAPSPLPKGVQRCTIPSPEREACSTRHVLCNG